MNAVWLFKSVGADWLMGGRLRSGIASEETVEFAVSAGRFDLLAAFNRVFCQRNLARKNHRRIFDIVKRDSTGCRV